MTKGGIREEHRSNARRASVSCSFEVKQRARPKIIGQLRGFRGNATHIALSSGFLKWPVNAGAVTHLTVAAPNPQKEAVRRKWVKIKVARLLSCEEGSKNYFTLHSHFRRLADTPCPDTLTKKNNNTGMSFDIGSITRECYVQSNWKWQEQK